MTARAFPNWFAPYAQPMFEKHLLPLAGQPGLRFLQIGAFTGDASAWLLENVLTGENPLLVDVDTWEGSDEPEHDAFDWAAVEAAHEARVGGRVFKFKGTSAEFFHLYRSTYDFVYIDGDHSPYGVLRDAVNAFDVLAVGGLIAFDDYQWTNPRTGDGPRTAVDAFEACYRGRVQLIRLGAQAWFRRVQ